LNAEPPESENTDIQAEAEYPQAEAPEVEAEVPEAEVLEVEAEVPEAEAPEVEAEDPQAEFPEEEAEDPQAEFPEEEAEDPQAESPEEEAEDPQAEFPEEEAEDPQAEFPEEEAEDPQAESPEPESENPNAEASEPEAEVTNAETSESKAEIPNAEDPESENTEIQSESDSPETEPAAASEEDEETSDKPLRISVTVPLYVCMYANDSDGTVVTPEDGAYAIQNNSYCAVQVTSVQTESSGWTLKDSADSLGTKELFLKLAGMVITEGEINTKEDSSWLIEAGEKLDIPIKAAIGSAVNDEGHETVCSVTYTIAAVEEKNDDGE
jgi:hypothetical protein